jgi:predicted nucleotide-binding protein
VHSESHILLRVLAAKSRVEGAPVVVLELQETTGLTEDQLKAAWRDLKDRGLIDAYHRVYGASINPRGVAALAAGDGDGDGANESADRVSCLTQPEQVLLDALASEYADNPGGVNAPQFLSRHEDQVADIEEFVRRRLIDRIDNRYVIRIPTLARLTRSNPKLESLWHLAGHVFSSVRQLYKVRPGDPIKVAALSVTAELPAPKVQRGLLVLSQAPIWTAISGDLSKITDLVTPSEKILGYKTLTDIVRELNLLEVGASVGQRNTVKEPSVNSHRPKVFIVHGHDDGVKSAVARFVERLGLEAVILHEKASKGRTIITKFREESHGAAFAVVIMTPDDLGRAETEAELQPRARQNVVFELGFFIGKLGPERVVALVKGNVRRPSDFDGVVYVALDAADWRVKLGQEFKAAGIAVDWNKVID